MDRRYYTLNENKTKQTGLLSSVANTDSIGLGMLLIAGLAIVGKAISAGYHLGIAKGSFSLDPTKDKKDNIN